MRALSLWQPWAAAVCLGWKANETRHWYTAYRGPLALHAAKRWTREEREFWEEACEVEEFDHAAYQMPLGAIVATVRLADVRRVEDLVGRITARERRWGNYSSGRYGFLFEDIVPLSAPIPYKGAQGFFEVPDDLLGRQPAPAPQGVLL